MVGAVERGCCVAALLLFQVLTNTEECEGRVLVRMVLDWGDVNCEVIGGK
jgi:hypothetical protein